MKSYFLLGNLVDDLEVPGIGTFKATMITAGIPTIFLNAADIGYKGTELQADINSDAQALARFEKIRSYGALKMGLISDLKEAETRQHTPKIAFVAPKTDFTTSSGKEVKAQRNRLTCKSFIYAKTSPCYDGNSLSVAIGVAACIEGTLVNIAAGGGEKTAVEFGHPSGTLKVGAVIKKENGKYIVDKATMSRSARIIMKGEVYAPADIMA